MHTNQLTRRVAIFVAMVTMSVFAFATLAGDVSAQTPSPTSTATATATGTGTGTATATAPAGGTATATASPSGTGATGATGAPSPARTGNAGIAGETTGGWLAVGLLTATLALAGTGWVAIGKRR